MTSFMIKMSNQVSSRKIQEYFFKLGYEFNIGPKWLGLRNNVLLVSVTETHLYTVSDYKSRKEQIMTDKYFWENKEKILGFKTIKLNHEE